MKKMNNKCFYIYLFLLILTTIYMFYVLSTGDHNIEKDIENVIFIASISTFYIIISYYMYDYFRYNRLMKVVGNIHTSYIVLGLICLFICYIHKNSLSKVITYIFMSLILNFIIMVLTLKLKKDKFKNSATIQILTYYVIFFLTYFIFANLYEHQIKSIILNRYENVINPINENYNKDLRLYINYYLIPFVGAIMILISTGLSFFINYKYVYTNNKSRYLKKKYITIYDIISVTLLFATKMFKFSQQGVLPKEISISSKFFEEGHKLETFLMIFIAGIRYYIPIISLVVVYMLIFVHLHEEK